MYADLHDFLDTDGLVMAGTDSTRERASLYAAGVVNYHSYQDLNVCLESVKRQTKSAARVLVVDGDPDPAQLEEARSSFPSVCWDPCPNRGYGAGANRLVERVLSEHPEVEFLLILNPDVELDSEYAQVLVEAMEQHPDAALASGKLLRPDGCTIDSAGIVTNRRRRPRDRGSDVRDCGQYERTERIFGASGAAMMIRCSLVEKISVSGEFFDEDFFAYHEDTDLSWRANLLGWSVLYVPQARAHHVRGWRRERRRQIPTHVRQHSFKNHYLQILKNEGLGDFLKNLPILLAWEVARLGFAVLMDPGVLPGYWLALRSVPRAWAKRRQIQARARSDRGPMAGAGVMSRSSSCGNS